MGTAIGRPWGLAVAVLLLGEAERRGGTVAADMPNSKEVCAELLKRHIMVDWRPRAGVRMSPHFYNKEEEIEVAFAAVEEILSRMPAAVAR